LALSALCAAFDRSKELPKDGESTIAPEELACLAPLLTPTAEDDEAKGASREGVLFVQQVPAILGRCCHLRVCSLCSRCTNAACANQRPIRPRHKHPTPD
jgi:hypothetical protein